MTENAVTDHVIIIKSSEIGVYYMRVDCRQSIIQINFFCDFGNFGSFFPYSFDALKTTGKSGTIYVKMIIIMVVFCVNAACIHGAGQ